MKKALLVGINYPGTLSELRGCINDIKAMDSILVKHYGFSDRRILLDGQATTRAILGNLEWLVADAKAGDVLYFHYSGHGSQMVDTNHDETDRLDEIICPIDLNWKDKVIRDDDFARIFSKLPAGVNLTVTLDCCHSGTGLRGGNKNRWIPAPATIMEAYQRGVVKPDRKQAAVTQKGILISGCKSNQTSADAWIGGKYMGACTYYLIDMLKRHNYQLDYRRLVLKMNHFLKQAGYTQQPELNCDRSFVGRNFLSQF